MRLSLLPATILLLTLPLQTSTSPTLHMSIKDPFLELNRGNCLRRTDRCCIWDGCAWCCSGKNGCSNEPFSGWGYCWG
ncbi:hypothetical protein BDV19DRAFT_386802 [Aspergillus venezuelensis]